MAAGSIVGFSCVEASQAPDAYFSSLPAALQAGVDTYQTFFTKISGVWNIQSVHYSSTGVASMLYQTAAQVPTFAACDTTENFFDGMTLGWGIVGAMVVAWVVLQLRRAL